MASPRALFLLALVVGCGGDDNDNVASDSDPSTDSGEASASTTGSTSMTGSTGEPGTAADSLTDGTSVGSSSTSVGSSSTSVGSSSTTDDGSSSGELGGEAPDFSLVDVNASSLSFDQAVSPRDYLEDVSGWYYAHST